MENNRQMKEQGSFDQADSGKQAAVELLPLLLENINGTVFLTETDRDGDIQISYASPNLFSVMGRDPHKVGEHGENLWSVVPPEDLKPLQAAARAAAEKGTALDVTCRVHGRTGRIEWRRIQGVRIPSQAGGPVRMLHIATDITEQKRTEESLQERNRILDFALRNTDINLWYFDCDTKECLLGENCQKVHEMPGDAVLHNFPECLFEIGYVREDCVEPLREAYRRLIETGENVELDAWFRRADGSGWWCERDILTAILGPDGRVVRGVGVGKDVTAEKRLEEKYRAFQSYRALAEKDIIASFYLNLTTGWIGECVSENAAVLKTYSTGSLNCFFDKVLTHIAVPEDRERCGAAFSRQYLLEAFARGETSLSMEYRYRRESGRSMWLRADVEMMRNPDTEDVEALLHAFDIDYEKNLQFMVDRLLTTDYEFLGLIDAATGCLLVFGKNKDVPGMARSGCDYEEEMRRVFRELIQSEYYDEGVRTMALAHVMRELEEREFYTCSFPARGFANTRAGRKQWKFSFLDETKSQILMTRTDITDLYTAEYDALTGLYNRQAFYRHVREVLNANPDRRFLLIRFDIDRFKAFNDLYGASAGDQLLASFGRTARSRTWPEPSVFGRLEADHFVSIMPADAFDVPTWHRRQIQGLESAVPGYRLTSSVGIYEIAEPEIDVSLMCDRALLALHTVKNSYAQKIAWYDDSLRRKLMAEQALADEMEQALIDGQFILYFQPQINYASSTLIGTEALVRWQHPKRGLIPPNEFIPLFEKNGFILKLDSYVWEKSCQYLKAWLGRNKQGIPLSVSVNISRYDFCDRKLCERLAALVQKYNIPPALLRLEITESAFVENPEQLLDTIRELRELGFTVEMDDFGAGYSSLNTLKDVPVDILKLDVHFLTGSGKDSRGGVILSSVIRMAHKLRLPIIAEGVETCEQAVYLKEQGCFYMQGYYFGKPMPISEFEMFIQNAKVGGIDRFSDPELTDLKV